MAHILQREVQIAFLLNDEVGETYCWPSRWTVADPGGRRLSGLNECSSDKPTRRPLERWAATHERAGCFSNAIVVDACVRVLAWTPRRRLIHGIEQQRLVELRDLLDRLMDNAREVSGPDPPPSGEERQTE